MLSYVVTLLWYALVVYMYKVQCVLWSHQWYRYAMFVVTNSSHVLPWMRGMCVWSHSHLPTLMCGSVCVVGIPLSVVTSLELMRRVFPQPANCYVDLCNTRTSTCLYMYLCPHVHMIMYTLCTHIVQCMYMYLYIQCAHTCTCTSSVHEHVYISGSIGTCTCTYFALHALPCLNDWWFMYVHVHVLHTAVHNHTCTCSSELLPCSVPLTQ